MNEETRQDEVDHELTDENDPDRRVDVLERRVDRLERVLRIMAKRLSS